VAPVRSRRLASGTASLVALVGLWIVVSASGGCVRTGASLGQSCLKDDDCFSGHCAAMLCVAAAPELSSDAAEGDSTVADAPGPADGPSADDAPSEVSEGSIDGGAGDALATDADASVPADATDGPSAPDATDGPGSTGADASPDATSDAPPDAPADAAADAHLDSGAG
jgi:hypothetical protein